jgi:serine/threonine-protein kinase
VPDVKGYPAKAAARQLRSAGFKVVQQTQPVKKQSKAGIVVAQSPSPGATAQKGSTVTISVGKYQSPTPTTTTTTPTTTTTTPGG